MSVITTVQRLRQSDSDPRSARRGKQPRLPRDRSPHSRFRKFLRLIGILTLAGVVIVAAGLAYAWGALQLPPDQPLLQTTFVTDASNKPLAQFNAGENRTPVQLDSIPVVLREAVIATEDRSFYEHKGVDPRGLARAAWTDIRAGANEQGGSTLSQQYVKTTYVGNDRTLIRKFKEAILAVKLEQKESKDEILERYLNTVYFGRGAYGVQAASKAYFGKDVSQLELKESAYLAGLLKAPELADASTNAEAASQRRDTTLNSMVLTGVISEDQRKAASGTDINSYVIPKGEQQGAITNPEKGTQYFVDYVKKVLIERYGEQKVVSGGLRVKTSIDMNMQSKAYDAVYGNLGPNDPAAALVTVDQNGSVKAMVGGRDWKESKVNLAVGKSGGGSGRQAGSTFKPFALAAAVEDDTCFREAYESPAKIVIPKADNGKDWTVNNFGNKQGGSGVQTLLEATATSTNTVYAQLNNDIGASKTASMARAAGVTSPVGNNVSNVLGTDSVSALEMAGAYNTFGQNGLHSDPNPLLEVKDANGGTLDKFKAVKTRAMSENTAETVNLALKGVVANGGSGANARIAGRELAGKTGTTSNNGDAWFVGYTPTMSTAIWMGFTDGSSHQMKNIRYAGTTYAQVTGGTIPASIFSRYMGQVAPQDGKTFEPPQDCRPTKSGRILPSFGDENSTTTTLTPDNDGSAADPLFPDFNLPDGLQDFGNQTPGNGNGTLRNRQATEDVSPRIRVRDGTSG